MKVSICQHIFKLNSSGTSQWGHFCLFILVLQVKYKNMDNFSKGGNEYIQFSVRKYNDAMLILVTI